MEDSILRESPSNGGRPMPPERRTRKGPRTQQTIPEATDMDRQVRNKKASGRSRRVASNSLTAIGTIVGLANSEVSQ